MASEKLGELEFGGVACLSQVSVRDRCGAVLLIDVEDSEGYDWAPLTDLPIPAILLLDSPTASVVNSALTIRYSRSQPIPRSKK